MGNYVLDLHELDHTQVPAVGGKAARLGDLARLDGVRVPPGFCVTTDAFRRVLAEVPSVDRRLDELSQLKPGDREAIRTLAGELREAVLAVTIPYDLATQITQSLDEHTGYAVRSSATAEDLPEASFAGQQDTYLNVIGSAAVLDHIRKCWASLFTDRAVTYRLRHRYDHRKVHIAVVVQRMVFPQAAGVVFTADPATGDRKTCLVEASFGLGEALVSGQIDPDRFTVRGDAVVDRTIRRKRLAIHARPHGGTDEHPIEPSQQQRPALTDNQALRLAQLGRRIAAHFGHPQDIEWCLTDDEAPRDLVIVQSRPITTLFPIPQVDDDTNHVYVSVGHQQMMTDPFTPLGLSFWQLTTPRPMAEAGGRLFVDVTQMLAAPASRDRIIDTLGTSDPLIGDALRTVVDREGFLPTVDDHGPPWTPPGSGSEAIETDPAIVTELIERTQASIAALKREIRTKTGSELFDAIRTDLADMRQQIIESRSLQVVMAGIEASHWLNERMREWLGEKNAADTLTQSVPHNVTSQMGLALLDVADTIRPYPELVAFLERVEREDPPGTGFLDELAVLPGGGAARDAIQSYLDTYGMRCIGEIDITRTRWSERPAALVPAILGHVRNAEPGAAARRFERGKQQAYQKERDLLQRLRALPDGERKAAETKRMIDRVRTFIGYREYPKYAMVSRYFVHKQALLAEAERLVRAGALHDPYDIYYLRFDELHDVVRGRPVDHQLIAERKAAHRWYQTLTPPRVLTSDGEAISGVYRRDDVPAGALVGLPVSAGTIEGRARVVLDVADAEFAPGDILVTAYTDPSWSPVFVAVNGLVTEVGGLMTHGAVIAREYGLPAVVGVEHATDQIRDGQRIRVNGTDGYVEILADT